MSRISSYFFFVLLAIAVIAAVIIFLPFLTPVILAAATAVLIQPLYHGISRALGQGKIRNAIAALFSVLIVVIVILVPLIFLVGAIYSEIQNLYGMLTDEGNRSQLVDSLNAIWQSLSHFVFGILPQHSFDEFNVTDYIKSVLAWAFSNLDNILKSVAAIGAYLFVFLLALYYFLRDGMQFRDKVISWSPELANNKPFIITTLDRAIKSVFAGTLAVSVLEGITVGLGFLVFGIPAPALWGTLAAVAAIIPGIGTSIIVIPGAAYLFISGHVAYGIGLLIWGYLGVFFIDHLLGPALINRGIRIHPFLVLLSVVGGILAFGLVGFLMGPLVLVFVFALLEIYKVSSKVG